MTEGREIGVMAVDCLSIRMFIFTMFFLLCFLVLLMFSFFFKETCTVKTLKKCY